MKTRIIYTKIHEDSYFRSLTDREQNYFQFLLTNEKVNLCGVYECPDWYVLACKPSWKRADLVRMKAKFMKDGKFLFFDSWIKIINYSKYNQYTGESNKKAIKSELSRIPDALLRDSVDTLPTPSLDCVDSPSNTNINLNKKSVIRIEVKNILEYFNQVFEKHYKTTTAWEINASKWLDIYSLDEIKNAIANWKERGWIWEMPKGKENLELLFRTSNKSGPCDYIGQLLNSKKRSTLI